MSANGSASALTALDGAPEQIGGRYSVLARLGRGGTSDVFQVRERSSGHELALKRLRRDLSPTRRPALVEHLEREFYALSQLRHPRVIEVYDYGVSESLPYYTMELLDGGDLRGMARLPWRRACELIYDVASSLALLHSRRFVHRDVTPANIRCTRDGRAKLIDFGAMVPMGTGAHVIGTPAYVAPEVTQRGVLDASTDLFSLGATLYFVVTSQTPFAAADLAGMAAAWARPPLAPSHFSADIPPGFDALVLSLLSIDPAQRPRSAFELMQRLAALADLDVGESPSVSHGYLSTPQAVGRDIPLRQVRAHLRRALHGQGGAVWIEGEPGVGRSRLLELCTLEAKTSGASAVYLDASAGDATVAGAERLVRGLLAALPDPARAALAAFPELQGLAAESSSHAAPVAAHGIAPNAQHAVLSWLLTLSAQHPLVIAVDDIQRMDAPSLALLAALAPATKAAAVLLIATAELGSVGDAEAAGALEIIRRRSSVLPLAPLARSESDAMFASVFGPVANLTLLSERVFAIAQGNPRRSLALAQYLVDQGYIVYASGAWSLPDELPLEALPSGVEALVGARLARLGRLARTLAEAQVLSPVAALQRDDYRLLVSHADTRSVDDALTQLLAHGIVRSDAGYYVLAQPAYASALVAHIEPQALLLRHEALARLAEQKRLHPWVIAYHLLQAGHEERALDLVLGAPKTRVAQVYALNFECLHMLIERVRRVSQSLGRPRREQFDLMGFTSIMSPLTSTGTYWATALEFRTQLESDAGLRAYRAGDNSLAPAERLQLALMKTQALYLATPPRERVYSIEEALRWLAMHVATSIAIVSRTNDMALLHGLPSLLAPFVSLSPLLAAIWENAEATCDCAYRARPERAYARWLEVHERLAPLDGDPLVRSIRHAVAYGLGQLTAALGLSVTMRWIEQLDREPEQRVNAMRVRRIVCLQHGDWVGAERAREQAELLALQATAPQVFEPPLRIELYAHWLARDLAGVKLTVERIGRLAQLGPGWRMFLRLAQGYFDALRGDSQCALAAFDECVDCCAPDPRNPERDLSIWLRATTAALAIQRECGEAAEALARAKLVLDVCQQLEIGPLARPIQCELALLEVKNGAAASAIARVERVISEQRADGVSGLQLAASYEARARVAIELRAEADAAHYTLLAERECRFGPGSTLSSRHAQLVQEARAKAIRSPVQTVEVIVTQAEAQADPHTREVLRTLYETRGPERASEALDRLCELGCADGGHLFLAHNQTGISWAASSRLPGPSDELSRFVAACWRERLEEAAMSAVLTELPWSQEHFEPLITTSAQGERYEVLVLHSPRVAPCDVGLALLRVDRGRARPAWSTKLLGAIASLLGEGLERRTG